MRAVGVMAVAGLAAALLVTDKPAEAGPAPMTHVFVVHGGNFHGQVSLDDGGSVQTVCFPGGEFLRAEFGQDHRDDGIELPSGEPVEARMMGGYPSGCDDAYIGEVVTPVGDEFAIVITARQRMVGVPIASCTAPGYGAVQVVHAANTQRIFNVHVSPPPADLGAVRYGGGLSAAVDPAAAEVAIIPYGDPDDPAATSALQNTNSEGGALNVVYIVGGVPNGGAATPPMLLIHGYDLESCATAPPPAPPPTPPAATPAAAAPRFTG